MTDNEATFREGLRALEREQTPQAASAGVIRRSPIAEQVADRITALVKSGILRPGEKLPTESQMALAFGISRPPLREALKALTIMGILESQQGGRYYVTDLSPARLVAPFSTMLALSDYDLTIHIEARSLVDMQLARLCTERASREHKARLMKLAEDSRKLTDDPTAYRLLDAEFHGEIATGAGNPLISAMSGGLYDLQSELRVRATTMPGVLDISAEQHCEIAAAILANNPEEAAAAIRRHLIHIAEATERASAEKRATGI